MQLTDPLYCLAGRQSERQDSDFGGHQATCSVRRVDEKVADSLLCLVGHRCEDVLLDVFVKFVDEVGGGLIGHFVEGSSQVSEGDLFDHLGR